MARLFRRVVDSSGFSEPRVLARVFPAHDQLERAVRFDERLTGVDLDMDLDVREAGLRIVAVGPFLLLDLDPALLDRTEQALATPVTMIFADLDRACRNRDGVSRPPLPRHASREPGRPAPGTPRTPGS